MGASQGPAARGEARRGRGGHDPRLQPHDQGVVGERCGPCGEAGREAPEAPVSLAAPRGPPTRPPPQELGPQPPASPPLLSPGGFLKLPTWPHFQHSHAIHARQPVAWPSGSRLALPVLAPLRLSCSQELSWTRGRSRTSPGDLLACTDKSGAPLRPPQACGTGPCPQASLFTS